MLGERPLAVVAPTLDADVLAVLARADAAFTPGQAARVLAGPSVEGVRRVLRRLTDQGIVDAEQVGPSVRYRLNREHLCAPSIIALADPWSMLLTRLQQTIAGWSVPTPYAAIFGSAARGEMRPDSDLNLFVVRPSEDTVRRRFPFDTRTEQEREADWDEQLDRFSAAATRWTGNDTRILAMTEAEVADGADGREPVLASIAQEGVTVVGDRGSLRTPQRTGAVPG